MKKYILSILFLASLFVSAQSTSPRFSTSSLGDNTGRVLTYAVITTTDVTASAIDTIAFTPNAWETEFKPSANLADSVVYKVLTSRSYLGDKLLFYIKKGTGAGAVKFFNQASTGAKFITSTATANVAIAANKTAIIAFVFNGTVWVEQSRMVQP